MVKLRKESNAINALEKPCAGRTFILDYAYPGQSKKVKEQIVDMALNGSGVRDTTFALEAKRQQRQASHHQSHQFNPTTNKKSLYTISF